LTINIVPFCEAILNSTSFSYLCRWVWLGGESSWRGSIFRMTAKGIYLVCGSSVEQVISLQVHGFTSLTQVHVSR